MTVLVTAGHDAWLTAVDIDRPEIRYRCIFGAGVPTEKRTVFPSGETWGWDGVTICSRSSGVMGVRRLAMGISFVAAHTSRGSILPRWLSRLMHWLRIDRS